MKICDLSAVFRVVAAILLFAAGVAPIHAEKILAMMDGIVYLAGGDSMAMRDSSRIAIPMKKKPLVILEHAYTARQKVVERVEPERVDSVVLWNTLAPARRHAMCYLPDYGWCWILERGPRISVYAFAPKGYHIAGNGGMWYIGKGCILVEKGGIITRFDKTAKSADRKFRERLAAMVADDAALAERLLTTLQRRDKALRMLSLYNPKP